MKPLLFLLISISSCYISCNNCDPEPSIKEVVNSTLDFSVKQSIKMAESLKYDKKLLPKTTDRFGKLQTCKSSWWVSGFFPGQLWYLYEYSGNDTLKNWAQTYSMRVANQQFTTDNHDVGFMIFCSFGNAYRISQNKDYEPIIHNAAKSLATRYNPLIGCTRSWDRTSWNKQWQYNVIIDNMMNLELLLWCADKFKDPSFSKIAISHANNTLKNHYRQDYSSFHVVSYDTITGKPELKQTAQGYSNESAWARGQAWGLYGFTMMYRFTKNQAYLKHAENIASFLLNHPRLPEDKIPYWDFDAPNIPDCYRDASAAAIICSALIELSQYTNSDNSEKYLEVAEIQIRSLASPQYMNALGNNGNFILKHGVGHMPNNTEIDVPLTYADYYFVEALMRYKKLKGF